MEKVRIHVSKFGALSNVNRILWGEGIFCLARSHPRVGTVEIQNNDTIARSGEAASLEVGLQLRIEK